MPRAGRCWCSTESRRPTRSAAGSTGPPTTRKISPEIRVVRGGGSVGNGPGALAGTIEMTSRTDVGVSGEIDGGSRDSLEARGRVGSTLGGGVLSLSGRGERSDGFIPVTEATRGPADERGALSRMERPCALGRADRQRHRGPGQPRRFPRLADARDRFHARTGPTAPTPRCGSSVAARGNGARSATGKGAT